MDKFLKMVGAVVVGTLLIALIAGLFAYPTKWIANWLFTSQVLLSLFGTPKIGFLQALALNFICGTLFKGSSSSSSK